jgi:hypothetical protein
MSKKLKAASRERKAKTLPEALKKHCWPKGKSGNPGGGAKKFTTLLTDAIRDQLGEISPQDAKTYAAIIGGEMVKAAAKEVKEKGLTNQVLIFYRDVRDGTEGKPIQKVILNGTGSTDPVERVKELLATALGRAAGEFSAD